ncbi:hypothetical protein [Streptomyces chryseus]|uniref:hypothetical protein n=1 Tax=Streptomyces chryseus TaxID=68186 RepID=UPI00110FEB60|nr:hypothetical protein [Streptomyces chryseus]
MSVPLSPWATDLFGKQALAVRVGVGQALRNMHANALAAQEQAASRTNHSYGIARWQGQYERPWEELKDLPGAKPVRPYGFPFDLMLIGRGLLYPFLYAKTRSDVRNARVPSESRLVKELFTFAPEPPHIQGAFEFEGIEGNAISVELRGGLASLPADTELVVVPFACNTSELLDAYWGIASLGEERHLQWETDPEPLTVPETVTFHSHRLTSVPTQPTKRDREHTSFDHGMAPALTLSSRPTADRQNTVPPHTEAAPTEDLASEDDATH